MAQVRSLKTGIKFKDTPIGKVPVDWEVTQLGDICEVIGGSTPSTVNKENWNGDILWATPTDITALKGRLIDGTKQKITEKGLASCGTKVLPEGTILMTSRATIGACAINTKPMATNQGFASLVCKKKGFNWFIYYLVAQFRNEFERLGSGSTFREISKKSVKSLYLPLPPLPEQKKIAEILSNVDDAIEETDRIINKTKEVKKGLMQELLTRGIGNKKPDFKQVPESWGEYRLDKLFIFIKSGLSRRLSFQDIGIPMLRSANINRDGELDFSDLKYWHKKDPQGADTKEYILSSGDLLINFINSLSQIGKSGIFEQKERDYIYTTNIFRAKTNNKLLLPKYFFYYSQTEKFTQQIESITKPAVNQASFTKSDFLNLNMVVPPTKEQEYIIEILDSISFELLTEHNNKDNLEILKKSLMQVLLTGKVRVKVA